MAIVRDIIKDALIEIGAFDPGDEVAPELLNLCLLRFQNQIDAWQADQLTIATPAQQVAFTLTSGTSTVTIGPSGDIVTQRPVWITAINYIVPGSSPSVETPMGEMDANSYANLSIKGLESSLPTLFYYNPASTNGELFFWPTVTQDVDLLLYLPQGTSVPASVNSTVVGPPGYQEAFMYQLALRLCTPLLRPVPPLLPSLASQAYLRMKRPNVQPGLLGVDQALVPRVGGAYNVLNDQTSSPSNR